MDGPLARILWQLRSYLPDMVLVGGWVPHLYRAFGGYPEWKEEPAGTREVDLLRRYTRELEIPVAPQGDGLKQLEVTVPRLGAFLVNKCLTFPKRRPGHGEATNPKRGKDLLYLDDVMAGGVDVVRDVTADLRRIVEGDRRARSQVETARNNLALLLRGASWPEALEEASAMHAEIRGRGADEARARVRGYLGDLLEILEEVSGEG